MTCPFLREAQVKYCRTATVRKLIPLAQAGRTEEKCVSAEHGACKVFQSQPPMEKAAAAGPCPYLCESLMQYCAAAPVTKLVPYSESLLSRCGNDSHRYCELYFSMAHPGRPADEVDGIAMPGGLLYTANHMWLDVSEDGVCHVGIDAFLSRLLGPVDRLTYVQQKGSHRPAAVVTVAGVDLEVMFPNRFLLTGCNLYLRANPSRLTDEPYTAGWLFEGEPSAATLDNLMQDGEARQWIEREQRRMTEFLQQEQAGQQPTMTDGGLFAASLAHRLDPDRTRVLFHEFFSPYAGGKRV
ncbi:MAG: glycine cleavage system protein H [Bryobacteraceae bacterium]